MTLAEMLSDAERRSRVVDACCTLVDDEVAKKSGFSGAVIKTAYKAVKGIKPGFIRAVVDKLFDPWVTALEPLWQEAADRGRPAPEHFEAERPRVAEALLSVTDGRIETAQSGLVRKTYGKLRPAAKAHVEEAVPGLAAILQTHTA